jgi:hypothetical protein
MEGRRADREHGTRTAAEVQAAGVEHPAGDVESRWTEYLCDRHRSQPPFSTPLFSRLAHSPAKLTGPSG